MPNTTSNLPRWLRTGYGRDHRFEWHRGDFQHWAERVARRFGYRFDLTDLGPADPLHGAPSQMAVFER